MQDAIKELEQIIIIYQPLLEKIDTASFSLKPYDERDLMSFWVLINKHIVSILKNTSSHAAKRLVRKQEIHSIEWLAADYNKHLLHHLHHLLEMEPVPYP